MLAASSIVASGAHSAASSSASFEIHRRRECKMERLWETAFAHVNATTEALFDAQQSGEDVSAVWTRGDSCGRHNAPASAVSNCFSPVNVAITDGALALRASASNSSSASVSVALPQPSESAETVGTTAHRLRIHAQFPTSGSPSNASVSLSLSAAVSASLTLESRANDSRVVRLNVLSPTRNVSVELTPPCPLDPIATKTHVVDIEWEASDASVQWIRWHWDGHALHDVGIVLPATDPTLTVGLSLVSTAKSSAETSVLRIKRLEFQRVASDQGTSVCRPRVIHADANCRPNHQRFEPRLGNDQGYLSLQQVYDFVRAVPSRFPPQLSSVEEIGVSTENRSLLALCIGMCEEATGNSSDVILVPQVLFTGMHHSREPISMMNLVYTIDLLALDFANGDVAMTALLLSRQLWFVLVVNPDGYARNEALETWANRKSGQRKNGRTDGGCETKADVGVDLNRNYDVCFSEDDVGSSTDPCGEDFRGPAPFSEPETLAIKRLVERAGAHFTVSLNYHSFGRYFNVPFACKAMDTPQGNDLQVYQGWAKEMTRFNGFRYGQPWKEDNLYSVNGETSDWLWAKHGIFSMSPEVGPAFSTPVDEGFWPAKENVPALSVELHYSNLVATELSGPVYEVVVSSITREPAADDDEELSALLHVKLELQNRGLRTARDVEIVLTTALEDGGVTDKFTTTARVKADALGTVRFTTAENATVARSLVIPEAGSLHLLVRDALSCQYIRLTTYAVASDASSVAFQQWQPIALPLCGICRSLGRDEDELEALGPAPQWCQSVEDLVQPDALTVAVLRSETLDQADDEPDVGDEERDTQAPATTPSLAPTPVAAVPTTTPESPATTIKTPTPSSSTAPPPPATTAPVPRPTPTVTLQPKATTAEPADDQASDATTSSSSSFASITSFVSVPILASVFFAVFIVFIVVLRRRRRRSRDSVSSHASGSSKPKAINKRKNYVQVVNEDDEEEEDDGPNTARSPRSRGLRGGNSDDEDAEYGRRRSPASP